MHDFLINLIIGIIGGVFSSVIVTRVFLIKSDLEEQIEILRMTSYRFGRLMVCLDAVEAILKLSSDTSADIEYQVRKDPDYLKTHDIIHATDAINSIKISLFDKTINEMCNVDIPLALKNKEYNKLQNEAIMKVQKYKEIKEFKFKTIDECRREIQELEKRYEHCYKKKGKVFIRLLLCDSILIVLSIIFAVLCILAVYL